MKLRASLAAALLSNLLWAAPVSSEFMADQQLNFVNNIFSANGSATYPTTGTGGYVQFNTTKTLQFLAGGQSVNAEDPSK
ncbi:MAG TPA: hypothetical protein P5305_22405 [Rubrivivax sp.]|nr:hypothetical protein [Rubrivivax sp.]